MTLRSRAGLAWSLLGLYLLLVGAALLLGALTNEWAQVAWPAIFVTFPIVGALVASRGAAVAVSDEEMIAATKRMGAATGIFAAPEGAATLAALPYLLEGGWIERDQEVVLFNTGSGLKYVDLGN